MTPLVYMQLCRLRNGIRRAFNSPVRALMTIFIGGYVVSMSVFYLTAPVGDSHGAIDLRSFDPRVGRALAALVHLVLVAYVLPSPKRTYNIFTETDVANLYPVPRSRWTMFTFFFAIRTLIAPIFFFGMLAMLSSRVIGRFMSGLLAPESGSGPVLWNAAYVVLVISAFCGLSLWRLVLDVRREFGMLHRNAFRITAAAVIVAAAAFIASGAYAASSSHVSMLIGVMQAVEQMPMSILLAPFTSLSGILLRSADPASVSFWLGILCWPALAVSGYMILRSQDTYLYEYCGRLAVLRTQMRARVEDPVAKQREKEARSTRRLTVPWFLRFMEPRRAGAIFWRESIITWRSYGNFLWGMSAILAAAVVFTKGLVWWYHMPITGEAVLTFSALGIFVVVLSLSTISHLVFSESLHRVEVQKPMPVGAMQTVIVHILQWTVFVGFVPFTPFILASCLFSSQWDKIIFVLVMGLSLIHTMTSASYWVALHNPDLHDPLQRLHATLIGFLVEGGAALPGVLTVAACFFFTLPLPVPLVLGIAVNAGVAAVFHGISHHKYVNFVSTM